MSEFSAWINECCKEVGSLRNFINLWDYPIPYSTALKWKCGYNEPNFWVQRMIAQSYNLIMYKRKRVKKVAENIRDEVGFWDGKYCRELCFLADMVDDWDNATVDEFETVIYRAANKLGVEI